MAVASIERAVAAHGFQAAQFEVEEGSADDWDTLLVRNSKGENVCQIERSIRNRDELVEEETAEFIAELDEGQPRSGAQWVQTYLKDVNAIYAFQFLDVSIKRRKNSIAPHEAFWALKSLVGGIIQADGEGFSNEDGFYVVLETGPGRRGPSNVALLDSEGAWRPFQIKLERAKQVSEFLAGRVPAGAVAIS